MHLQELKKKTPKELLEYAEQLDIESAGSLRRQDLLFSILKKLADNDESSILLAAFNCGPIIKPKSDAVGVELF